MKKQYFWSIEWLDRKGNLNTRSILLPFSNLDDCIQSGIKAAKRLKVTLGNLFILDQNNNQIDSIWIDV